MILIPHQSRCPACKRLVFAMDDLFAVRPWQGEEEIPDVPVALYHYACFLGLPRRDEYLRQDARAKNRILDEEDEYLTVLARTESFALALRPVVETYVLYFLPWGRQLVFSGVERWNRFQVAVVAGTPTPPNGAGEFRITRNQDRWELANRHHMPIEADLTPADFARLRQHLAGRGTDPSRTPVNLGTVCAQLGITPTRVSCPPERLVGTFTWPDAPADPTRPVTLTVRVEQWTAVALTDAEMQELRAFLGTQQRPR